MLPALAGPQAELHRHGTLRTLLRHALSASLSAPCRVIACGMVLGQGPAPAKPSATPPAAKTAGGPARSGLCRRSGGRRPAGSTRPGRGPKQEHLQKIRQLTFDRRPSAISRRGLLPGKKP